MICYLNFIFNKKRRRYYPRYIYVLSLKKLIFTGIIASGLSYFIPYGFLSFLLVILAWLLGHMQYRNTAIGMSDSLMYMSYNGFTKKQSILKNKAIQSMKMSTTFFRRKKRIYVTTPLIFGEKLKGRI